MYLLSLLALAALLGLMTYSFTWLSWQQIIIEKMIVRCKYYARSWRYNFKSDFPCLWELRDETVSLKAKSHSLVHCSIIHNSQDMETIQMSINRRIDYENVVHTYPASPVAQP